MNKVRGYIFSRSFMGERVPQHVQNIVIKGDLPQNFVTGTGIEINKKNKEWNTILD